MNALPTVTIGIPTYNEANHIETVLRGFLQSRYPHLLEILVVDGGSTDGTQAIVERIAAEDARVQLLPNPYKIQSAALNRAIHRARGQVFLRADAHAEYAPDYVEQCVQVLLDTNALNVGGAQRFVARQPFQAGVALAAQSILGHGGAKYRLPEYAGYAESVYLGCFWKHALDQLIAAQPVTPDVPADTADLYTPFDLEQATNQDAELNLRLLQLNPHAIYISPQIRVWYYPRATLRGLWRQYFRYGRGRCRTVEQHPDAPLRGRLPFLVLSLLSVLLLLDTLLLRGRLHTRLLIALGVTAIKAEALRTTWRHRHSFATEIWRGDPQRIPPFVVRWLYCTIALLSKPLAHFLGYAYQLWRMRVLKRDLI